MFPRRRHISVRWRCEPIEHGEGTSLSGGDARKGNMEKTRLCLVEMQEKGTWRRHVSVWWRCKKREHGEGTSLSGGDARKGNMEKTSLYGGRASQGNTEKTLFS